MAAINLSNVYSGPDALRKYFDPEFQPPLPLVEIPKTLNPFYDDGVRIYGKMMSMHPANNVKIMPAMNMLAKEVNPAKTQTVVEYSSGSTVISLALASRIYHGIQDVKAFLSNKTTASKLRLMQFFGLELTLFGGPAQPQAHDPRGGIFRAKEMGESNEAILNANQYENDANWQAHVKWTGPQIHVQLPSISIVCAGMGTTGTMTGIGQYFKKTKSSVTRVGVCTAAGERVPGPRSLSLIDSVSLPWQDSVDAVEEVGSKDAFSSSLQLCREGLVCGPSSGLNLQGLLKYLQKRKAAGTLSQLAGPSQVIDCVFICCDMPYQYIDEYFLQLGNAPFRPIQNENLTKVDLHRYDEAWELEPGETLAFYTNKDLKAKSCILDLRRPEDVAISNIPSALNVSLQSLESTTQSPFFDADLLESQWKELESTFTRDFLNIHNLQEKEVQIVCYNGDTARVATSVLRAKGVVACSIKGGFAVLQSKLSSTRLDDRGRHLVQQKLKIPEVVVKELRADSLSPDAQCRKCATEEVS